MELSHTVRGRNQVVKDLIHTVRGRNQVVMDLIHTNRHRNLVVICWSILITAETRCLWT